MSYIYIFSESFVGTLVNLGVTTLITGLLVAGFSYWLAHRKGSADSARLQIEEKKLTLDVEDNDLAETVANQNLMRDLAELSQNQAREDRARAQEATTRAQVLERDVATLREAVRELKDALTKATERITELEERVGDLTAENRAYRRANQMLEEENHTLHRRTSLRRSDNDDPNMD